MSSTKIINVSKDDKFEEILDLFKNTAASEVIFVLPRNSKAFKKEEHFNLLKSESTESDKTISFLCSNPETNQLAQKYDFNVLIAKDSHPAKPLAIIVDKPSQYRSLNDEDEENIEIYKDNDLLSEEDEDTEKEAKKHGMVIEESENSEKVEAAGVDADVDKEDEEENLEEEETEEQVAELEPEFKEDQDNQNDYLAETIAARKGIDDILDISTADSKNIKILKSRDKLFNLGVKKLAGVGKRNFDEIKEVWQSKNKWDREPKRNTFLSDTKKLRKTILWTGVAVIILVVVVFFTVSGSAKIKIVPQKKDVSLQLNVSASDKFSSIDPTFNKIPGQLFNIQKSVSRTFQATGEKDVAQKARGKITIYNELSSSPQLLIATTRFESENNLIFRTIKAITVPGTKVVGGKIVAGSIEVDVIADKPGQDYNISAGNFKIPAFKERGDTARYEKIYGKSTQPMKGGTGGKAKVVTEADYNKAKDALTESLKKELADELKSQTGKLKIIDSTNISINNPSSTADIDVAADEFTMTLSGYIKTIGFKEEDLKELAKGNIEKKGDLTVLPDKISFEFSNIKFNNSENTMEFSVKSKTSGYIKIDSQKIVTDLLGKNEVQIKDYYLKNSSTISAIKISLSPFWVSKVPQNAKNVKVEISYE